MQCGKPEQWGAGPAGHTHTHRHCCHDNARTLRELTHRMRWDVIQGIFRDIALQRKVVCTPNLPHDATLSVFLIVVWPKKLKCFNSRKNDIKSALQRTRCVKSITEQIPSVNAAWYIAISIHSSHRHLTGVGSSITTTATRTGTRAAEKASSIKRTGMILCLSTNLV